MNKSEKRILIFALIALAIGLVILAAGLTYIYRVTPEETHSSLVDAIRFAVRPGEAAFGSKTVLNFLCLGLDYNYDEKGMPFTKNSRTDTIFVLHLESDGKVANILSIPRDTRVLISDAYGYDKINAAYANGDNQVQGINNAKEVIQRFLGLQQPFDHYILIRVQGAKKLVDALGGVTLDVEEDMNYDDNWGNLHVHLKKGVQRLNGEQAVGYCRFRHDVEGDFGRIRRQQQFFRALVKELKKPTNIVRLDKIARAVKECLDTDLNVIQLVDLARVYKDFDRKNMHASRIKGDTGTIGGVSYVLPDEKDMRRQVCRLILNEDILEPGDIRVEVLNGCGVDGVAGRVGDALTGKGYQVTRVENAERKDYLQSQIIDHIGKPQIAVELENLAMEALKAQGSLQLLQDPEPAGEIEADFTIIVGKDLCPASHDNVTPKAGPQ